MDIQKKILAEAVHIYFANGDWQGYIKQAVKEQRRKKIEGISKQAGKGKPDSNDRIRGMA